MPVTPKPQSPQPAQKPASENKTPDRSDAFQHYKAATAGGALGNLGYIGERSPLRKS